MSAIKVSVRSLLDYTLSSHAQSSKIIKQQKSLYLDPDNQGFFFYGPIYAGLRRCVAAADPTSALDRCVAAANPNQRRHYVEIRDGFLGWWNRSRLASTSVKSAVWQQDELSITVRDLIGGRLPNGDEVVIVTYVKEAPLLAAGADPVLRLLEQRMDAILPGAKPIVLDTRRSKPFRLRSNANRNDLDAFLIGVAAQYIAHWNAIAA
jgi:hypothetical protein